MILISATHSRIAATHDGFAATLPLLSATPALISVAPGQVSVVAIKKPRRYCRGSCSFCSWFDVS